MNSYEIILRLFFDITGNGGLNGVAIATYLILTMLAVCWLWERTNDR